MTKIIQVIGLPCAGKSTLIKQYIKKNPDIKHIDIADFNGKTRQKEYKKKILNTSGNIIAESACGVSLKNSEVIQLKTDMKTIYKRTKERDKKLDEDYLSLLRTEMIPSKYTVTKHVFEELLNKLFNKVNK